MTLCGHPHKIAELAAIVASLENEVARRSSDGGLIYQTANCLRHTSSVSQARHLLLKEKANFTVNIVFFNGRTQFDPNGIQFTLRFCLRDAEAVVPYDGIADL